MLRFKHRGKFHGNDLLNLLHDSQQNWNLEKATGIFCKSFTLDLTKKSEKYSALTSLTAVFQKSKLIMYSFFLVDQSNSISDFSLQHKMDTCGRDFTKIDKGNSPKQ